MSKKNKKLFYLTFTLLLIFSCFISYRFLKNQSWLYRSNDNNKSNICNKDNTNSLDITKLLDVLPQISFNYVPDNITYSSTLKLINGDSEPKNTCVISIIFYEPTTMFTYVEIWIYPPTTFTISESTINGLWLCEQSFSATWGAVCTGTIENSYETFSVTIFSKLPLATTEDIGQGIEINN